MEAPSPNVGRGEPSGNTRTRQLTIARLRLFVCSLLSLVFPLRPASVPPVSFSIMSRPALGPAHVLAQDGAVMAGPAAEGIRTGPIRAGAPHFQKLGFRTFSSLPAFACGTFAGLLRNRDAPNWKTRGFFSCMRTVTRGILRLLGWVLNVNRRFYTF